MFTIDKTSAATAENREARGAWRSLQSSVPYQALQIFMHRWMMTKSASIHLSSSDTYRDTSMHPIYAYL